MKINPIQSTTLQKAVYNELFQAIVLGNIPPGEKLTITQLAEKLNVSIMPVREAIRKLEAIKLVSIKKNRGILVVTLSKKDLIEIQQVRLHLEKMAIKKACKIRSERTLKKLEKLNNELSLAQDEESYLRINREFHRSIYQEADSPILLEIIDSLWERISPYLHILLRQEGVANISGSFLINHTGMLEGVRNKDPKEVCKWLEKDLSQAAKLVSKMIC